VVSNLKSEVERLNPKVHVRLGEESALGNPRLLNSSRFQDEFDFRTRPIFEQLRRGVQRR
jgi:hypothetical protein